MEETGVDKDFELLRFVSGRNRAEGRKLETLYKRAGLRVPEQFGDEEAGTQSQPVSPAKAKIEAVLAALKLASKEFDQIFKAIRARMNWRSRFKLISAVIGAVASSSLVAMLGSDKANLPWGLITAIVALLASLATIVADRLGISDKEFWDKLTQASQLKADSSVVQARLDGVASSGASEADAAAFVARAWEIVEGLTRLNAALRIGQVDH
ncbi:hypothetical protein X739_08690 [Mesorhizobium sp. LNHC220B00]|nr:hypothetical protein X739_08690 [Mesorhizobium sp. LNHC220B00]